ncbi:MAG: Lrp/AsnC family transcriptional regulator, partial [FCB group bacterium]|nr:Lrp/AsnC family transcriptional regulator [FCB group bacterium]
LNMNNGAYIIIKFDDHEKLLPALQTLSGNQQVSKWDAVDGYYDLIVKLKEYDSSYIEQLKKIDGATELIDCELINDNEHEGNLSSDFLYSYLFIECDKNEQDSLLSTIEKNEAIVFCSSTSGKYNLIAMAQGKSFDDIDKLIDNNIRTLNGVLRLKQDRIIKLDSM